MAGTLRTWVQDYVRAHRSRPTPPNFTPPAKRHRGGPSPDSGLGHRLASEPQVLEKLVAVQPHTIAVVLAGGQPPQIKRPGEQLRPSLLSGMRPTYVVVVSTAPTRLDLRLDHLQIRDRDEPIEQVVLRVGVQVSELDGYAGLLRAAQVNNADLDAYLVECVKRELADKARRAMGNNILADLEPQTMERALLDYPMPTSFADGVLDRKSFTVLKVSGSNGSTRPPLADSSPHAVRSTGVAPDMARPGRPVVSLTMDAGLRRLWQRNAEPELLGIADAQVGGRATVLAVPVEKPGPAEETRLREEFGRHYPGRHTRLVSAPATTYEEIVRTWFREVAGWPRWVKDLLETEGGATLQVQIDYLSPVAADERRREVMPVGEESDREALRRLLPFRRVEFVSADASDMTR